MSGKKSSPPPPNYEPLARASEEAARIQGELGREQLDFARDQFERTSPLMENIANQQIEAQREQMDQARDYYDYQRETYRPLEKSIVADAKSFNTESYRDQMAGQAAADAGRAFGLSQQQNQRAMASMGVNPNSGRFAAQQNAAGLQQAAGRASAMTGARTQATQMGYARQLDAAGLGRGLAGASAAAYGGASNAGSMAGQNFQAAGQNYMGNMAIGAGTIAAGQNMQIQGLSSILNNQTNAYVNSNDSFLGDLGGALGGAASLYKAFSDRRMKEDIKPVGVDPDTGLNLYEFSYKGDTSRRFRGVMADEVLYTHPEAVCLNDCGFLSVKYGALNIEFTEVH